MKQRITIEQLNELSPEAKNRLREWWRPKEGDWVCDESGVKHKKYVDYLNACDTEWGFSIEPGKKPGKKSLPLLSIGQMIEFLDKNIDSDICSLAIDRGQHQWHVYVIESIAVKAKPSIVTPELCDALWEAVKESLE